MEPSTHESHGVNTAWIQPEGSSSDWPAVSTTIRASARSCGKRVRFRFRVIVRVRARLGLLLGLGPG